MRLWATWVKEFPVPLSIESWDGFVQISSVIDPDQEYI